MSFKKWLVSHTQNKKNNENKKNKEKSKHGTSKTTQVLQGLSDFLFPQIEKIK